MVVYEFKRIHFSDNTQRSILLFRAFFNKKLISKGNIIPKIKKLLLDVQEVTAVKDFFKLFYVLR